MERIFIGAAWPYVNGPQHIGHLAGCLLPADIFARYHRLKGDEVLMVSGSDMHGTPTTLRAEMEGVSPEALSTQYHLMNREAFQKLGLSFDLYTTTHTPVHEKTVQEIFLSLLEKRYLEKKTEDAAYCTKQERFLPDRYVTGTCPFCGNPSARGDECDVCSRVLEPKDLKDAKCRLCGTPAIFRPSEQFYFTLPKLAEALKSYHDTVRDHWRPSVGAFTQNYLAAGLRPRAITRDIQWGVPIPLEGYESKRIYVWFEAVMGYLSASREWAILSGDPDRWKRFWAENEPGRMYNFLGKDNISFHTVLWPAILLAVGGLKLPYDVPANEFMNLGGSKLSKSRTDREEETPVYLPDLLARFDPDVVRFYAAYHMPQNHDTEFNLEELSHERDQILADQWGNLVQRVLSFVRSNYNGIVPHPASGWTPAGSPLGQRILATVAESGSEFEKVHLKEALDLVLALVRESNRYFHEAKPWSAEKAAKDTAVYETLWAIRALCLLLSPFLPFSSAKVAEMLGEKDLLQNGSWGRAGEPPASGKPIGTVVPLFPKPSVPRAPAPTPPSPPPSAPVTARLDIRVARVVSVTPHPNAERLYVIQLDDGRPEGRTVVAGLRQFYSPEELQGKHVAILANLQPRTLRGIKSEGMILAATAGSTVSVLRAGEDVPPGTPLEGVTAPLGEITYEEFTGAHLTVETSPSGSDATVALSRNDGGTPSLVRLSTGALLVPDRPVPPGTSVS
ncbi:MAG: methionine--tRNA ligase [Candidatus Thermoplasmatota archaeon]|jgi:methionyl-tRNA synthetase|nr:methionine--tRNA ligase [Candidatus Thermoplasmatota archaeon]MCL5984546.1 methionine--tRNA ligase [Candidatus Thermoplasmatota archaeon]